MAIDQLQSFNWPLWNPYSFTGTPLLANYQSAALFPLNILLFLPGFWGWGLLIFSQTLVAALGMYLLLSCWLSSRLARMTGSIIFAFGGLMTTWTEFGTAVWAMAFLPVSLFLVERFTGTRKMRYPLMLILTLTLTTLAGNPQTTVYSFVIIAIFAVFRLAKNNISDTLIGIFPVFLAIAFAVALSAPQLFPSFELVQKSIRTAESYTAQSNFGLLPLQDFLKFFVADFFGNPVTANYWGFLNYFETSGFVGSLTLPLLLFAIIFLKKNRISNFFLFLLASSLILSFDNPVSRFAYSFKMPFLTQSYASRMLFVATFAISVLAAYAVNEIRRLESNRKFLNCIIWSWGVFAGILLGAFLSQQITDKYHFTDPVVTLRNSVLPFFEISLTLLIFIVITKINFRVTKKYKLSLICAILLLILTFDLSRYFLKFNPFVPEKFIFPKTPALEYLLKQPGSFRIGREHAEVLPPNTWAAYKLQSIEGYDVLHLLNFSKIINHINGNDLLLSGASRYEELTNYKSPFIDAANVKYFIGVLRDKDGKIPGDQLNYKFKQTGYKQVFQDKSAVILQNPYALERAYFAKNILTVPTSDPEKILARKDFDPTKTTLLSKDLKVFKVSGEGKAEIIHYAPNIVRIRTTTPSDEVLVLADQYEEGWKAQLDGQDTLISPANLIFRAVKVPAGTHEIIFSYYPKSFDLGLKIALATLLIITFIIIVSVKQKRF